MPKIYPARAVGIDIDKDTLTVYTGAETPVEDIDLSAPSWWEDLAIPVEPLDALPACAQFFLQRQSQCRFARARKPG